MRNELHINKINTEMKINRNNVIFIRGYRRYDELDTTSETEQSFVDTFKYDCEIKTIHINYNDADSIKDNVDIMIDLIMNHGYNNVIGHSLGGFIAMYLSSLTNVNSILLNPSSNPTESEISTELNDDVIALLSKYKLHIDTNIDRQEYTYPLVVLGVLDTVVDYRVFLNKYAKISEFILLDRTAKHKMDVSRYKEYILQNMI